MIFVTVGTHEQQFDRLLIEVDRLVRLGKITEKVFIQTGYSNYVPTNCECVPFLSFEEMQQHIDEARIVITHGGPASFINVLKANKSPIVVPRLIEFGEHVNNHQLLFSRKIAESGYGIRLVENIGELNGVISSFQDENKMFISNNAIFNSRLKEIVERLMEP